jgi:3-mercaptopyruvate sulfurtransferase SseA
MLAVSIPPPTSNPIYVNKESAMYDGSLAEWTTEDGAPMERQVSLD